MENTMTITLEGMEAAVLRDALKAYGPSRMGNHTLFNVLVAKLGPDRSRFEVDEWVRGSWRCHSMHTTLRAADSMVAELESQHRRAAVWSVPDWSQPEDGSEPEIERARRT